MIIFNKVVTIDILMEWKILNDIFAFALDVSREYDEVGGGIENKTCCC